MATGDSNTVKPQSVNAYLFGSWPQQCRAGSRGVIPRKDMAGNLKDMTDDIRIAVVRKPWQQLKLKKFAIADITSNNFNTGIDAGCTNGAVGDNTPPC